MSSPQRTRILLLLLLPVLGLALGLGVLAWRHFYPVTLAAGWSLRVLHDGLEKVSALVEDDEGGLFVSQELQDGKGRILRLHADGSVAHVLNGLSKPDGLVRYRGGLAITQEGGRLPLFWLKGDRLTALFNGENFEGVASDGNYLYAIEDKPSGRLLRYDPDTDETTVLRDGLVEGEGVSICPDGRVLYVEKGKGRVREWRSEGNDRTLVEGLNQPGFLLCSASGVWISEDATHMARLLWLDTDGQLQVVADHLRSAQTLLEVAPGRFLLAEQGRNRILEIQRTPQEI